MSERLTYINGKLVPESQAMVSVFDRGFLAGHGAFERARTFRGEPFRLEQHLARLYRSLNALRLDLGITQSGMLAATLDLLERNVPLLDPDDDYIVGHYVTRGPYR